MNYCEQTNTGSKAAPIHIRKNLLQQIFSGACLWRWNDKLRPIELAEIDKQAHKMLVAFVLWHESARDLSERQRVALGGKIIEGALFDYFYRIIVTDIKPPVFYKIKENPEHYRQLTKFVLGRLEPVLGCLGFFWQRMRAWHCAGADENSLDRRILAAAHLFASRWEFNLIRPLNSFDDEMESIAASFQRELDAYADLPGMKDLLGKSALAKFANLCGQLRFQIRWTQAPRIPPTSVLGHMFIVASCAYLFSLSLEACQARANNNFFAGLFHDMPELLTRDIISPVKKSFAGISRVIREYEEAEMERKLLAPLRNAGFQALVDRIAYYLGMDVGSEFQECCLVDGKIRKIEGFEAMNAHNQDKFDPKDGKLLKICDLLAAFLEAYNSIHNGLSSPHLLEARARLKIELLENQIDKLQMESLLADFD